jgi:hypothetical protein
MASKLRLAIGLTASLFLSCRTAPEVKVRAERLPDREMRYRFIEKGYESTYTEADSDDFEAFIASHGSPEGLVRKPIVNRQDRVKDEEITLQYKNYDMNYYVYSKRELWHPPKSLLMAVLSKGGGRYLFGIRLGMARVEVLGILGLADSGEGSIEFGDVKGHKVRLSFADGALSAVVWDYSDE